MGVFRGIFGVAGGVFLLALFVHMLGEVSFESSIMSLMTKVLPVFFGATLIMYGVSEIL